MLRKRRQQSSLLSLQQSLIPSVLLISSITTTSSSSSDYNAQRHDNDQDSSNNNNNNNKATSSSSTSSPDASFVKQTLQNEAKKYQELAIKQQQRRFFLSKAPMVKTAELELFTVDVDDKFVLSSALKIVFDRIEKKPIARVLLAAVARGHYRNWPLAFRDHLFACPLDRAVDHLIDETHNLKDNQQKSNSSEMKKIFGNLLSDLVTSSEKSQAKRLGLHKTVSDQQQQQQQPLDGFGNSKKSGSSKKKGKSSSSSSLVLSKSPPKTKYKWIGWEQERKNQIAQVSYSSSSSKKNHKTAGKKKIASKTMISKADRMKLMRKAAVRLTKPSSPPKLLRYFLRLCWPAYSRRRLSSSNIKSRNLKRVRINIKNSSSSSSPRKVLSRLDCSVNFLANHLRVLETEKKNKKKTSSSTVKNNNNNLSSSISDEASRNVAEVSARLYFLMKNIEIIADECSTNTNSNNHNKISITNYSTPSNVFRLHRVEQQENLNGNNNNNSPHLYLSHPYHLLDLFPQKLSQKVVYALPARQNEKDPQQHQPQEFIDLCPLDSSLKRVCDCEALVFPQDEQEQQSIASEELANKNANKKRKSSPQKNKSAIQKKKQKEDEMLKQLELLESIGDDEDDFEIDLSFDSSPKKSKAKKVLENLDDDINEDEIIDSLESTSKKSSSASSKAGKKMMIKEDDKKKEAADTPREKLKTLLRSIPLIDGGDHLAPAILLHRNRELNQFIHHQNQHHASRSPTLLSGEDNANDDDICDLAYESDKKQINDLFNNNCSDDGNSLRLTPALKQDTLFGEDEADGGSLQDILEQDEDLFEIDDDDYLHRKRQTRLLRAQELEKIKKHRDQMLATESKYRVLNQVNNSNSNNSSCGEPLFFVVPIEKLFENLEKVLPILQNENSKISEANSRVVINRCDAPVNDHHNKSDNNELCGDRKAIQKWWGYNVEVLRTAAVEEDNNNRNDVDNIFESSSTRSKNNFIDDKITNFFFDHLTSYRRHQKEEMMKKEQQKQQNALSSSNSSSNNKKYTSHVRRIGNIAGVLPVMMNASSTSSAPGAQSSSSSKTEGNSTNNQTTPFSSAGGLLSFEDTSYDDIPPLMMDDGKTDQSNNNELISSSFEQEEETMDEEAIVKERKNRDDFYLQFQESLWKRIVAFKEDHQAASMTSNGNNNNKTTTTSTVTTKIANEIKTRSELYELAQKDLLASGGGGKKMNSNIKEEHFDLYFARLLNAIMVQK